jgi:hypothetical protein
MMTGPGELMPQAKTVDLVVEALRDETLVYDLKRHKAHCLNRAAALVWAFCDGRTTVAATAAILEAQLPASATGDALVRMGLEQLARAHLLVGGTVSRAPRPRYSRRAVLRALGVTGAAALLPPLVETVVSPVSAEAASCLTPAQCRALIPPFCSGQPICGDPGRCCRQRRLNCRPGAC